MTSSSSKSCPSCGQRYDADVLFCPQDGTPIANTRGAARSNAEVDMYVGLELAGQIRIKHLIGIGAMGRVYRAFQGGIERDVAVKILHRELSGNTELVGRFHREAKIASRLTHPNVVSVLMAGSIPQKGDPRLGGEMYLVMEHLDGMSLLSALAAAGTGGVPTALPLSRAMHIALQICEAVGEAHAQGIVHRDIKPENVMLIRRGDDADFVKVLDFGIARLDWNDRSMATQAGLIFGTAKYISPEGAEGKPVTPAADVYSIATVLYQCLAGRTPFEGDSPVQILVHHTHSPPPDLLSIPRASYVPAPIANVIMQNLAKKPDDRASDARALGKEIYAAARESGLDPDELLRAGLHAGRQGAVKLPSKERTKSLDLSPELAARIGGVAARSADVTPLPVSSIPEPAAIETLSPSVDASTPGLSADASHAAPARDTEAMDALPSTSAPVVRPYEPSVESLGDEEIDQQRESSELTMQGTEAPLSQHVRAGQRRARITRIIAISVCLAAVPFVAVIGGKRLGLVATSAEDSLAGRLDAARDAMRLQAWDAPPNDNVKDILDKALVRWPGDPRVLELRREAAERLVTSALGRKYAGDPVEALHLARIAVSLHPSLTTAQHLVAELQGQTPTETSSAAALPHPAGAAHDAPAIRLSGRLPGQRPPTKDGKPPASAVDVPPNAPVPSAPATTVKPTPTDNSPVLPPTPPPLPADHGPTPPQGGPWL